MAYVGERLASFRHAGRGVLTLLSETPNARLHLLATVAVAALGLWLDIARADWPPLLLAIGLVWSAEAMNSALEYLCDAALPEHNELIGKAKDTAAAGVLICSALAVLVGLLVLGPYLLAWFTQLRG
ncbi:MAG: diacylglycerol kinase family protein [Pseudomonadota bacterium]